MAIKTVRAQIAGTWYNLTYNSTNSRWEATVTAPGTTSYTQPAHYYNVSIEATNDAGTSATATASDLDALKLFVREKTAPVITIVSPGEGAFIKNPQQAITFQLRDEAGGSGVDLDTLRLTIDGGAAAGASASGMVCTPVDQGYDCIYTPSAISDGNHTVSIAVSDHDGNAAAQKSVTYKIDTVPPTLNVTVPANGLVTNTANVTVRGVTNDVTSAPVTVAIKLGGVDQGAITVASDGTFMHTVTLAEGVNAITVTATDTSGLTTSIDISVTLDTTAPKIVSASIMPNPADVGATMLVSVVIE